jgi:hypothetical protein
MGTQRTSNKDILDAINAQTAAIAALATALTPSENVKVAPSTVGEEPAPVASPATETESPAKGTTIKVDEQYKNNVLAKAKRHATKTGETVLMYARRNLQQQVKLGYCVESNWTNVRERNGTLGLIGSPVHPA